MTEFHGIPPEEDEIFDSRYLYLLCYQDDVEQCGSLCRLTSLPAIAGRVDSPAKDPIYNKESNSFKIGDQTYTKYKGGLYHCTPGVNWVLKRRMKPGNWSRYLFNEDNCDRHRDDGSGSLQSEVSDNPDIKI